MQRVRVRQLHRSRARRSPVSGHEWFEHTPISKFEVVGPFGPCGTFSKYERAEVARQEWEDFYNKFFPVTNEQETKV